MPDQDEESHPPTHSREAACWRYNNGRCSHPAVHCSPRRRHAKQLAGGITTGDAVIQQYTALINVKQLAGGITTGDAVIQQYTALLDEDARDESFKDSDISETRVDTFLHDKVSARYSQLWGYVRWSSLYNMDRQPLREGSR